MHQSLMNSYFIPFCQTYAFIFRFDFSLRFLISVGVVRLREATASQLKEDAPEYITIDIALMVMLG